MTSKQSSLDVDTTHIMIDIETYGLSSEAVILSIGATSSSNRNTIHTDFYAEISLASQTLRSTDPDTVAWWNRQAIKAPNNGIRSLDEVLKSFTHYITAAQKVGSNALIWANGTDFDIAILCHAFRQVNLPIPWAYNNVRDYRTLKNILYKVPKISSVPISHHALEDALNQMNHLQAILTYARTL